MASGERLGLKIMVLRDCWYFRHLALMFPF